QSAHLHRHPAAESAAGGRYRTSRSQPMSAPRMLFIDRDGTLISEPPDQQIDSLPKLKLVPGVIPALLRLQDAGYRLLLVSNQDGLGTASFPQADFDEPHAFLMDLLASQGIRFDKEFICPHLPADNCSCRKPLTGLLDGWLRDNPMDRERSYVIGDRQTDLQLAENLGIQGLRVRTDTTEGLTWDEIATRL